ncbi:DUF2059 domain-containing protein [Mucilaginibacter sp. UYCu711]|uniref:DUF2059 domain-containing protein n=1 Tax=Mucilaginibacter sp. UYCu711 TaxID=3156339 RepID=UPI003D1C3DA2
MKRSLFIILLAAITLNVSAQKSHEKTLKLFKLMGTEQAMDAMSGNMTAIFSQSPTMFGGDQKKQKELAAFSQNEIKKLMPQILADMVPVYEKHFTQQEIQKYIDFYSTPEGKKLANSAPVLQKEMITNMMTKYMPQLRSNLTAKMQELNSKRK